MGGPDMTPSQKDRSRSWMRPRTIRTRTIRGVGAAGAAGLAGAAMILVVLLATTLHLVIGPGDVDLRAVSGVLAGGGDPQTRMVVLEWRLPRAALAILVGAVLAISGMLVQTLAANDLGSPDLLGLTVGAHTGVLVAAAVAGASAGAQLGGALLGSAVVAAVVLLLVRGQIDGPRLVLVGVGAGTAVGAVNTWLMLRAERELAMAVAAWSAGTLNDATLRQVAAMAATLALAVPLLVLIARPLRMLELGPETVQALGVRLGSLTVASFGLAVVLAATATAVAGPIAFVALAAPHIARSVTAGRPSLALTALTGATLLVVADLAAKVSAIPVGLVTLAGGGLYLAYLLALRGPRRR